MGEPSERQQAWLEAIRGGAKFPLYGGARGGGKSWSIRRAAIELLLTYRASSGLILRRTYPDVIKNHVRKLAHELPQSIWKKYNSSDHILKLPNGSTLEFGYCKTDADVLRYQGNEYDFVFIDEGTQWQEYWYDCIRSSVRSPRGYPTVLGMGANPGGIGHLWVKQGWIDNPNADADHVFIPAKVYDNPVLMLNDPGYVHNLEAIKDANLRRAWLDGDWDIFAGQFFHELRREVHGFMGEPPAGWTFRMLDYGEAAPSAVYWGRVDYDGGLWLYRELYGPGMIYSKLAEEILKMDAEEIRYTVGSPDIFQRSKGTGEVGSETLAKNGVPIVRADNNRIEGWRQMREWMAEPTMLHVHTDNCQNWWRTVPAQIYDEHNAEDMDPDGEDHSAESTRYGIMSRPRRGEREEQPVHPHSAQAIIDELREGGRR